jgi:hypothetical protein
MQRLILLCLILVFSLPALAQNTTTSPIGLETAGGDHFSYWMGRYADGRFQVGDGELRNKALTITQIDFRIDNRSYGPTTGTSRTWTRVTVDMSETEVERLSQNWVLNATSTPTRVFDSRMTWATINGRPTFQPWGQISFPFKTAWFYSGKTDMLRDYWFRGGTLANAAPWSGSTSALYYLDGVTNPDSTTGTGSYMPAADSRCNDSAVTLATGAYAYGVANTYNVNYSTNTYRDKLRVRWYSYYTAPDKPVFQVVGVGVGNTAGVEIGARCNRLYVDLSKPYLLLSKTAQNTAEAYSGPTEIITPWETRLQGLAFHVQAAWADSRSGLFSLTRARSFVVPGYPTQPLKKRMAFRYSPESGNAIGPIAWSASLPLPRLTHK